MTSDALTAIGRDPVARARIVAALTDYEQRPENRFTTVRDEVTGPIVDALHAGVPLVRKELANGLRFELLYRSKIARDFVLSVPERPDHVWEPQTTRLLLHLAARATDVIVGGAYFGDHAIPLADALRPRGACHAFEVDPEQAAMLQRNADLNGLDNVRVHPLGLWSDTTARLQLVGSDAMAGTVAAAEGIAATTIDAYAAAAGIDHVGLIMLDLEGGELPVLRGAERVLRQDQPHVVFEIHRAYVDWTGGLAATAVAQFLRSFGYTLFALRDFQSNVDMRGKAIELVPIETAYLDGPPHGFNVLAVRDASIVEGAPFRIVPHVSPKLLWHRDPALHHPLEGL
ncbi:MAG TPA: FkbM family methyltransferase [Thermoanaerobaculia bacterium]|nr:FkbM family methyltransferase [Thermoanaerobaculia bacterium]